MHTMQCAVCTLGWKITDMKCQMIGDIDKIGQCRRSSADAFGKRGVLFFTADNFRWQRNEMVNDHFLYCLRCNTQ